MIRKPRTLVAAATLLAAFAAHADIPKWLAGESAPVSAATRTINITPQTRWVNVDLGETVAFVVNGQSFAFDFDGPHRTAIDLQQLAPAGLLDHRVMVYADPSAADASLYSGR